MTPAAQRWAAAWVLALVGCTAPPTVGLAACPVLEGVVDRVVDGDTVRVFLNGDAARSTPVRLLGVDAPERCQAGGSEATRFVQNQLPAGTRVRISNACRPDRYGRLLGTLTSSTGSLNEALLDAGLVWHWTGSQPAGQPRGDAGYATRQTQAQQQRRGVFAHETAQSPSDFRRQHGPC